MTPASWTQALALNVCRQLEAIAPRFGAHVALTGGCLYKLGPRKDLDVVFYRIRQVSHIDVDGLMEAIRVIGIKPGDDFGWCYKATYLTRDIDFFFPEREGVEAPGYGPPRSEADAQADKYVGEPIE